MRRLPHIFCILLIVLVAIGCKRRPSYVMGKEEMAQLMADMHVGESVVDMNHSEYPSDSQRILLRQSILAHHHVTQEDFDTSLVWYGRNMDKYVEVYERTIEILEERNRALGNAIVQTAISISGDSVDVWPASRYARFNNRMPSHMLKFDMDSDANWEPGDVYTWRIKVIDEGVRQVRWSMLASYTDSTCEWLNSSSSSQGWNEVVFTCDSTKTLTNLRGYFEIVPVQTTADDNAQTKKAESEIWIDSISLVRKRANPEFYQYRSRLRKYDIL